MAIELLDKKELARYLKVSIPTLNRMVEREQIPGVLRLTDRLIRFRKDTIDEWLEGLPSKRIDREQYTKKSLKIPGKRGNYSWAGTLKKIERQAREKKIDIPKGIYPLFLFQDVLGMDNETFTTLLEDLALKKVIELVPIFPCDIKKGMRVYEFPRLSKDKKYYSFVYKVE